MDIALPGEGDDDLGSAVASAGAASRGGELSDEAGEDEADIHLELPLLSVQDDDHDLTCLPWNGETWASPTR